MKMPRSKALHIGVRSGIFMGNTLEYSDKPGKIQILDKIDPK
jgi:hypothetical protein